MHTTCHSETGKIKRIYIKRAAKALINEQKVAAEWEKLNFLGKPYFEGALQEYSDFESVIRNHGAEIHYFDEDSSLSMDSIYCRDASIATDFGMIICRMGKPERMGEPEAQRKAFTRDGVHILGEITIPGTVEGGDLAWLDEKTLAVGHTYRTNEEGIHQLRTLLEPHGIQLLVTSLPHYKGTSDVFHLMSILSPVAPDVAVVYSPLMPIHFRNDLINRGFRLVEVPDEEFETMGCNVLALSPGNCLMVDGNPITKKRLEEAGCTVTVYKGNEISVKGGGGPTCLTRPMEREG